jgi:hypothetical protein
LGGADQITESDDRLAVGHTFEAKVLARRQPGRQLGKRKRVGDEPHAIQWAEQWQKAWADAMRRH